MIPTFIFCVLQSTPSPIHIQEDGVRSEKASIVFINGLGQELELWDPLIDALKSEWHCVRFDFPGFGQSPVSEQPLNLEHMRDICVKVIKDLNLGKVHLVGISLGSFVAQEMASAHPELLKSLVLMSSSMGSINHVPPEIEVLQFLMGQSGLEGEAKTKKGLEYSLHSSFFEKHPDQVQKLMQDFKTIKRDPNAMLQQTFAGVAFDAMTNTPFPGPVLIVHGLDDRVVPVENAKKLHGHLKGSQLVVIPNSGHLCHLDATESVAKALTDFFVK